MKELAEIICRLVPAAKTEERPSTEPRPERGALDIQKAHQVLGYKPRFSLEEGMKRYVEFVREHGAQ
jgi:nucleoside-diphosphate-sugar epimerase